MAGALSREQEIAIFSKQNKGVLGLTDTQRKELYESQKESAEKRGASAIRSSVPTSHEKSAFRREFEKLKENSRQKEAVKQAQKDQNVLLKKTKQKALEEISLNIQQEQRLRQELAEKKITFDEYQSRLKKLREKAGRNTGERDVLPAIGTYDEESRNALKQLKSQEAYYQDVKNPMKIFPSGSQTARLKYNPETKKYDVTHRLTVAEQNRLGVENPVMEAPLAGSELVINAPAEQTRPAVHEPKPTFKNLKEKQQAESESSSATPESKEGLDVGEQLQVAIGG